MEAINYHCTFTVKNTPQEVHDAICKVREWWGDATGNTTKQGDEFTFTSGETHVDFKITEMIPGKKIVWTVTDCYLHWLSDKKEWKGTSVNFDIAATPEGTRLTMTHIGLTSRAECYEDCRKGWDFHAGTSLYQLITEGKGKPATSKKDREQV